MIAIIKNETVDSELYVKEFYFNGKYEIKCPVCQSIMVDDFNRNYLSYPVIGERITRTLHCSGKDTSCETTYEIDVILKSVSMELEIDENSLTSDC